MISADISKRGSAVTRIYITISYTKGSVQVCPRRGRHGGRQRQNHSAGARKRERWQSTSIDTKSSNRRKRGHGHRSGAKGIQCTRTGAPSAHRDAPGKGATAAVAVVAATGVGVTDMVHRACGARQARPGLKASGVSDGVSRRCSTSDVLPYELCPERRLGGREQGARRGGGCSAEQGD